MTKERIGFNMKKSQNKWICAAIPALLLHCSIGTVYCWSIFSQEIADYIGFSKGATEWVCRRHSWEMWWRKIFTNHP